MHFNWIDRLFGSEYLRRKRELMRAYAIVSARLEELPKTAMQDIKGHCKKCNLARREQDMWHNPTVRKPKASVELKESKMVDEANQTEEEG